VDVLRGVRKQPADGERIELSAADPLNLVGVVLPGARIPAVLTNTVTYVDGIARERTGLVDYLGDYRAPGTPLSPNTPLAAGG
jgi:hypothetical protein